MNFLDWFGTICEKKLSDYGGDSDFSWILHYPPGLLYLQHTARKLTFRCIRQVASPFAPKVWELWSLSVVSLVDCYVLTRTKRQETIRGIWPN